GRPPPRPDHDRDAPRRDGLRRHTAQHRGGTVRTHDHPALPAEAARRARVALLRRAHCARTRGRARDPGLYPEPRAQIAVWGRAPRSATWGAPATPNGRLVSAGAADMSIGRIPEAGRVTRRRGEGTTSDRPRRLGGGPSTARLHGGFKGANCPSPLPP